MQAICELCNPNGLSAVTSLTEPETSKSYGQVSGCVRPDMSMEGNLLLAVGQMEERLGKRGKLLAVEVAGTPNAEVGRRPGEVVGIVRRLQQNCLNSDEEEGE